MKTILVISILLLAHSVFAAGPWYVDYVGGSDANNGTATATPWKHIPGDPSATGNSSAATGLAGTLYLKGGVIYAMATSGAIVISSANYNTAGPMTITSGTNVSWGSGTSTIDGAGVASQILWVQAMTFFTLRGVEVRTTITPPNQLDIMEIDGCLSNVVDNCDIHDAGTNTSVGHVNCLDDHANSAPYYSYLTVTNCRIYNATQKCLELFRAGGDTVVNNVFHDASDHLLALESDANRVYGNVFSNATVLVFQYPQQQPGYAIKLTSATALPVRTNLVYNNLIEHCHQGGICIQGNNAGQGLLTYNRIFNNTLIDIDSRPGAPGTGTFGGGIKFAMTGGCVAENTEIRNNLICSEALPDTFTPPSFYVSDSQNATAIIGTNNQVSHNLTFDASASTLALIWVSSVTRNPTWANYSDSGSTSPDYRFKNPVCGSGNTFDLASQFFDIDPKFVNYPTDLHLKANSPVATAGTNLSGYFTTDYYGTTRVNWSIGAIDHLPAPPTAQGATISIGTGVNLGNGVKSL